MKIGRKIALFYTLVTVLTTMAVIGVFYLFSSRYIDGLYRSYLREKAFLTAQKHWERDEVDEQSYQTIQRKYDELLPEAKEILLDMDSDAVVRDTLNKYLSAGQQKQLLELWGQDTGTFAALVRLFGIMQLGIDLFYRTTLFYENIDSLAARPVTVETDPRQQSEPQIEDHRQ